MVFSPKKSILFEGGLLGQAIVSSCVEIDVISDSMILVEGTCPLM